MWHNSQSIDFVTKVKVNNFSQSTRLKLDQVTSESVLFADKGVINRHLFYYSKFFLATNLASGTL